MASFVGVGVIVPVDRAEEIGLFFVLRGVKGVLGNGGSNRGVSSSARVSKEEDFFFLAFGSALVDFFSIAGGGSSPGSELTSSTTGGGVGGASRRISSNLLSLASGKSDSPFDPAVADVACPAARARASLARFSLARAHLSTAPWGLTLRTCVRIRRTGCQHLDWDEAEAERGGRTVPP